MRHLFMSAVAHGLLDWRIATLRFDFPYMESGSKRPDRPEVAHDAIRAAVAAATYLVPGVPLIAGGKSFGGRMTSQAQALEPLPGVRGLVFFGFPLHPAGKPSTERAEHLSAIDIPMLFLQGSRDALASMDLLEPVIAELRRAELSVVDGGNHSLGMPKRSGKTEGQVMAAVLDVMADWVMGVV